MAKLYSFKVITATIYSQEVPTLQIVPLKKAHNANVEVGLFGALEEKLVAIYSPVGIKAEKIEDINMLQTTDKLEEGFERIEYIYITLEARRRRRHIIDGR